MKIEIERGYPYDNAFARGTEIRLRILYGPLWYYRRWNTNRPLWKFPLDYLRWRLDIDR